MTVLALHTEAAAAFPTSPPQPVCEAISAGQLLIGGRWVDAQAGETMDGTDPTAAASITYVQQASADPLKPGTTTSAGEGIAKAAPGAKMAKAMPPFAEVLHTPSTRIGAGRPGVFVCGGDVEARRLVVGLAADMEADGVDAGRLTPARCTEPLGMLLVQLAYVQGFGTRIGTSLLREPASTTR